MFSEGAPLDALESVDSRRYLPHALVTTGVVIVAPAILVIPLSPFAGIQDIVLSALLATGLSAAAGSVCSALWTRRPESREIPFGDLLLWSWARRVQAERRFAKAVARSHRDSRRSNAPARGPGDELAALRRLSVVFEARDASTHGHTGRVTRHAERIAERMGLPASDVAKIRAAASVHDVGKVRLPRSVLMREGELTPGQQALLEQHAADGAEKVAAAGAPEIAALVRHHHECVDGTGYPDRLAGDDIPLGARIIAVADAFDRLATPEPGRPQVTRRRNALDGLCERAGSQLDATAVGAFVDLYSGKRAIAGVAFAATAPQRLVRWVAAAPTGIGASAPPLAQGVCAAGALALAGSCLTTLPPPAAGVRAGDRPPALVERAPGLAGSGANVRDWSTTALDVPPRNAERPGSDRDAADRDAPSTGGDLREEAGRDRGAGSGGQRAAGPPAGGGPAQMSPPAPGGATPASEPASVSANVAPDERPAQPSPAPKPPPTSAPAAPAPAPTPSPPPVPQPTRVVEPVLDQVQEVLDPLPTEQLTDPVERLLGNTLGR